MRDREIPKPSYPAEHPAQFAGSWDSVAGHQANLYADNPGANSIDKAVRFYMGAGIHPSKLVIGE
jgi:chitinase